MKIIPEGGGTVKSYRKELWFATTTRRASSILPPMLNNASGIGGIAEEFVLSNAMHITASVFINDDESGLHQDYEEWLEKIAPTSLFRQYHHNRTGEDNETPLEAADHGKGSHCRHHRRQTWFWTMGTDFLWWNSTEKKKKGAGEDHRGVAISIAFAFTCAMFLISDHMMICALSCHLTPCNAIRRGVATVLYILRGTVWKFVLWTSYFFHLL